MRNSGVRYLDLYGAFALAFSAGTQSAAAQSTTATAGAPEQALTEIVVTAQKRSEDINKVGMSVQTATGRDLIQLGITDTADLTKIVPGFNYTTTQYGTAIYTMRGVGFQETSLAGSPTVSVYSDEFPIPFSIETKGTNLDVQRVEVLKGPQGTLFGENATGGAINYIANKPTDRFSEGFDATFGRFGRADLQGFVSGPITDTLDFRLAGRALTSGDWQQSYTHDATSGAANFYELRGSLLWMPTSRLQALFTLEGWLDHSDTQQAQLFGINNYGSPAIYKDPRILAYPLAPNNDRAADWSACVNTSPYDPPFNSIPAPYGYTPPRPTSPTNCTGYAQRNSYYRGSLRLDYDLGADLKLTSLSSFQYFDRYSPVDSDGMIYQDFETLQKGHLGTTYQELRLSGTIRGRGSWIVGSNYQRDSSYDNYLFSPGDSSTDPTSGVFYDSALSANHQTTDTYAGFADVEYPVLDELTAQAGVRYTQSDKSFIGCLYDGGSGTFSDLGYLLQAYQQLVGGYPFAAINPGPGGCVTTSGPPTYNPPVGGYHLTLDESNVSWRAGLSYAVVPGTLLYANVSQGYKSGSFPTLLALSVAQLQPAKQEGLLAYEAGFKSRLFDGSLQLNGAGFYYHYTDKQITGEEVTLIGPEPLLINVPHSHVIGTELSAQWQPFRGVSISPAISYTHSEIDGNFYNYDAFGELANFKGQSFPQAPELTANIDFQYAWTIKDGLDAYVGGNVNHQGSTQSFLVDEQSTTVPANVLEIPHYTLVDLRAGVIRGPWSLQLWGHNVTNQFYLTNAHALNDVLVRYTGMPATFGVTLSWRH